MSTAAPALEQAVRVALEPASLERRGLSLADVAREVGVARSTVSRFRAGERRLSPRLLERAAELLLPPDGRPVEPIAMSAAREYLAGLVPWRAEKVSLHVALAEGRATGRRLLEGLRPRSSADAGALVLREGPGPAARLSLLEAPAEHDVSTARDADGSRTIRITFPSWAASDRLTLALEGEVDTGGPFVLLPQVVAGEVEVLLEGAVGHARPLCSWALGPVALEAVCSSHQWEAGEGRARLVVSSPLPGVAFGVSV